MVIAHPSEAEKRICENDVPTHGLRHMSPGKNPPSEPRNDFRKFGLDPRVVNALAAQGIFVLEDLAPVTEKDLAHFRGIGPSTRKLLKDYLKKEGADAEIAISLVLSPEVVKAVDAWCVANSKNITSRAETIRRLVEIALQGASTQSQEQGIVP